MSGREGADQHCRTETESETNSNSSECTCDPGALTRQKWITMWLVNLSTVDEYLGPYGGPRGGAVSYERGTPVNAPS